MRNATNQASNAANTAAETGADLGGSAAGINGNLTPFLTQEMLHPEGIGQTGLGAEQAAAQGGAGGAEAGFVGQAAQRAATSRNAGGYQAALADAARSREQAAAGVSEGIVADNEKLKQQQSQEGAEGLGGLYKTDTSGMLTAMGQIPADVNSEVNAGKSGWLQDSEGILNTLANIQKARG